MTETPRRPRGRPRAFDPDAALDRAIELFWTKGYDATSLDDLSAAMGIGRPSIYNAFGDKQSLFMRSLERYSQTVAADSVKAMNASETIEDAIAAFLRATAEYTTRDPRHAGCLLGSVAPVSDNAAVRYYVKANVSWTEDQVRRRLADAVKHRQLPRTYSPEQGARRAINAMLAIAARARLGTDLDELLQDSADATAAVLS
jgi:AcrR family transcriptional regulator